MSADAKRDVLIVILNYKGWKETLPCVERIFNQTYTGYDIFLVENGSGDESAEKLADLAKDDRVIYQANEKNLGFSGGVNQGIRYAIEHGYPYTVLLNNDAFIDKDWLRILRETIEKTDASVITGLLLNGKGDLIESTGDSHSIWSLPFPRQREEKTEQALSSGYVFGGTAGASLYRTDLFKDIGLFDEVFFAYFEDTDINFRSQLAGHTAYYEKTALAYHDHGTTSNKMPGFTVHQTFQNLPLLFWKDTPAALLLPMGIRFLPVYGLMYIRAILRGQFMIATKGVLHSLGYLPHAFRERRKIQEKRRVSIDYLRSILYNDLPPNNRKTARRIFHR